MGAMKKIFIIHGWTYTLFKWDKLLELIKLAGYEPVMLKVPGLTEAHNQPLTLDDYVEWLKGKLAGQESPIVVGHSNGGRIALAFLDKYPAGLKLLVLEDSAGIYPNQWPKRVKRFVFKLLADAGKKITSSEILRKLLYKLAGEADYKNAPLHMRKTLSNLVSVDLTPVLNKVSVPTLIVWGARDKATPLSDGKLMHKQIKNSEFFVISDAGHSPHFSHAEKVCEKIISFTKQHGF